MKKLIFLIWLLAISQASANLGRVFEDVSSPITFKHTTGCDSVVLYIGNDSTSWDQDSVKMSAVFNADKTCWLHNVTLTTVGSHTLKFNYYETGAASVSGTLIGQVYCDSTALKVTNNIGINWADITNPSTAMNFSGTNIDTDQKVDLNTSQYGAIMNFWMAAKGVIEDSINNGALNFQTNLSAGADNYYNRQLVMFLTGGHEGMVRPISDYTGASGVIFVRPGLEGGGPNAGDSIAVLSVMAGVMPNDPDSILMNIYSGYVELSDAGVDAINSYAVYATKGAVGGTPGVTGFSSATLDQADDHWNDNVVLIFTGTQAGQSARITDFTAATDSITFTPAFSAAPAATDSFFILGIISESGAAGGGADSAAVYGAVSQCLEDSASRLAQENIDTLLTQTNADTVDGSMFGYLVDNVGGGAGSVPDSLLAVVAKIRSLLMNPLPGSIIPNGHLQISQNDPDSTDPAGWATLSGTGYLTTRRAFEGYERSLYFADGSLNTLEMKLDTGYYELSAQIFFGAESPTLDTAYFQCYNSANDAQTWLSSGSGVEYITGWSLSWHRLARLIHLTGDSTFYFTIGANAGDSAYFAEVSLMPYGAVGHTVTAAGTGAFSCSLFAYNSGWAPNGGSPAITSGSVRMISGVNEYVLPIDANGWVEFSLDGGTWNAYATALRFIQDTVGQTFTFSDHYVDTVTMTAFSPSTPTDTGKVNLYVWTDRILGDTLEGATFRVIPIDKGKSWVTGGGRVLPLGEVTKKTNSNGYAEIEVYQSSYTHPYPSGSDSLKYNISITYPGLSSWAQFRFVAPDSGSQYQIGLIE